MSLTTRQRTSIFQKLVPVLGEEDADALVAQFPAAERDVLVTREHLRAEFAEFRAEIRSEIRSEMAGLVTKAELAELRSEMAGLVTKAELAELRSEMATKADLRAEAADLRVELATKAELAELRSDLRVELAAIRSDMHAHLNKTMGAMTGILLAAMGVLAAIT